jgi:hypothetical protein
MGCRTVSEGISMLLPMDVYKNSARFVVDTGAAVTVMASHIFNAISEDERPPLQQPDVQLKLEVANDSLLEIEGCAKFRFKIGKKQYEWVMYVAPIREDGLLA